MQVRQAPLYGIDGVFETLDNWNDRTTGGLDVYEPGFQVWMFSEPIMFCPKVPQDQWSEHKYAVRLTIPRESKTQTLFYFCHIHRLIDSFYSSGMNINSSVEWVGWSKWRIQQNQLLFRTSSFKVSTRTNIMQHSPILMLCAAHLRWSYSLLKLWKTYQYSQVSDYHEKKDQFCPNMNFLCEKDDNPQFSRCMEAIDCKVFLHLKTVLHVH